MDTQLIHALRGLIANLKEHEFRLGSLIYATIVLFLLALAACQPEAPEPTPTVGPLQGPDLSPTDLKYRLIANFGGMFYCDPDLFPVAREGQEEQRAREEFPRIQQDAEEFQAMLRQLDLQEASSYTDEQQLLVYREHKKLNAVILEPSGGAYKFEFRVQEGDGFKIEGIVDRKGVTVLNKEPSFNICPICLAGSTRIDTPKGQVMVRDLLVGMEIWTVDVSGARVAAIIKEVASSPAPEGQYMIHAVLDDGRALLASPGHPLADGRTLEELVTGSVVDGARVISIGRVSYEEGATYDILPEGGTGRYWANGILIGSTLSHSPGCGK
ncbi:MAG: Hint domain-containing protein [Dehalococcoidia bacterium]